MDFGSIPDRKNGPNIDRAWFNDLKAAGFRLEGGITASPASIVINNNQSSPLSSGITIDGAIYTSAMLYVEIKRATVIEIATLKLFFDGTNWDVVQSDDGTDAGVTFSMSNASGVGTLNYVSTDTSAGLAKYSFIKKMVA